MIKINKNAFLTVALFGALFGLTNCSSTPTTTTTTTNTGNTAVVVNNNSAAATPDIVKADAPAGEKSACRNAMIISPNMKPV